MMTKNNDNNSSMADNKVLDNVIDRVVRLQDFIMLDDYRQYTKFLCVWHNDITGRIESPVFQADPYAIARQLKMLDYSDVPSLKNELYIFPKSFSLMVLAGVTDDYIIKPMERISVGNVYSMLTDRQKVLYSAYEDATVESVKVPVGARLKKNDAK